MAMKAGSGGDELNAEINVTPFVDVMLVLLIIFMITAPMMNTGVSLELPQVTAQNIDDPEGKLPLSIQKAGPKCHTETCIFLGTTQVTWADLEAKLKANERVQREQAVVIAADTDLPYGVVLQAMAIAKNAGVEKVLMQTDAANTMKLSDLDKPAGK
jgi:biopolymer transport protein TolR